MDGVVFTSNMGGSFFAKLLLVMDISMFDWYIDDTDLNYFDVECGGLYHGDEVEEVFHSCESLSFARIRRYAHYSNVEDVDTIDDYMSGKCNMLILFYDGGDFEIYDKNPSEIIEIYELCRLCGCDEVRYIDVRTEPRQVLHF